LPNENTYARFGSPYDTPLTVTVDDVVKVYAFDISSSRTADVTFTGSGLIETYRQSSIIANVGTSHLTFDVIVTNVSAHGQTVLGGSTFKKRLYIGPAYDFYIGTSEGGTADVSFEGNADLTAKYLNVYPGSALNIYDNARVDLERDLTVKPGGALTVSGDSVINLRKLYLPFSPEEGVNDEWVMNGGMFRGVASSDYRLELPYTNAVKTLSGTGIFHFYRFYLSNASNLTVRLNGPDVYLRQFSGGKSISLSIGNGSTFGAWGADVNLQDASVTTTIDGEAVVDTTDYEDGETARTVTIGKISECEGVLTVKGNGTCLLARTHERPDLDLVGKDSATIEFLSDNSVYAVGDIVLNDSAKMKTTSYIGHLGESHRVAKSLAMDGHSSLDVGRYVIMSGDAALSGNASAVVRNTNSETGCGFTCADLSLADDASLVVTGNVSAAALSVSGNASLVVTGSLSATSLSVSGNAHLAFTAGTAFLTGATFGDGDWSMEITVPPDYEAGLHPIVRGIAFDDDFTNHVSIVGEATGWSVKVVGGMPILYKESDPVGVEWIGDSATSDNWSDTANWNGGNVPTADDLVAFGGLDRPAPYNDSVSTVSGLVFRASAGPFTITGSVDSVTLKAECDSRSDATVDKAAIVSHSGFDQTIELPINFTDGNSACVLSDGGGAIKLLGGLMQSKNWEYLLIRGEVHVGGTCSVGILSFLSTSAGAPSCLRVLSGCDFTSRYQYYRSFSEETKYIGRIVVEEGGVMTVKDGDCCFFHGALENVIDGTLVVKGDLDSGRLVATRNEQYYVGKGAIYADSARAGRHADVTKHYINFGGTLKLYMNGNWYTATYREESGVVQQNPNYPTRFRMTDGTTLGATKDWTYGPRDNAYDTVAATITPADRTSIMVGTVTVNTQSPEDDEAHTITFVDPLDASAANVVKAGSGTLVFNEPSAYPSQVSNLTVNAGSVQFAGASPTIDGVTVNVGVVRFDVAPALRDMTVRGGATVRCRFAPALSGTLTLESTGSRFFVDGLADTMEWDLLATAPEIVGPEGEAKWRSAFSQRFRIVTDGAVKKLYGAKVSGMSVYVR